VEVFSVRLPFRHAFVHHLASRRESRPQIVRLTLSGGAVGYGEALPRPYLTGETEASVVRALNGELTALVLGQPVAGLEAAVSLLESATAREARARQPAAFCGLELALLDAAGRQTGRPVTDVLGPVCRTELPYESAVVGHLPLTTLRLYLRQVRKLGKRRIKLKVGFPDDLEHVAEVRREMGPSTELVLDANGAWSAAEAIDAIRAFERFGLTCVEQPTGRDDVEGMAKVHRAVGTPLMADESICTLVDAQRLLDHDACDVWNLRVGKCGGLLGTLELVRMAAAHGVSCQLGVLVGETGILGKAGRLLAACVPDFTHLEFDSTGMRREDLLREPLDAVVGNRAPVPLSRPGLGLGLDTASLDTLAENRPAITTLDLDSVLGVGGE
jgi:muconate cycloisomerase